jgi:hypothetical protein
MFQPIRTDPPADLVRRVTFVPFLAEPYGVDISPALAELARRRLPQWHGRIWIGNADEWRPPAAETLRALGFRVAGQTSGGDRRGRPPVPTAWITAP